MDIKKRMLDEIIKQVESSIDKMLDELDEELDEKFGEEIDALCFFSIDDKEIPIDMLESDDRINVVIGLAGVKKEDLHLLTSEATLSIITDGDKEALNEIIGLPALVDPKSAKASFRNGILEIVYKKLNTGVTEIEIG